MFLGIAILGAIFMVITFFSIVTARHKGESTRGPILVMVLTVLVTIGAVTQLPYWSQSSQSASSSSRQHSRSLSSQSGQAFSSSQSTTTKADNERQVRQQLAKSLKKIGTVTFDHASKTYTVTITNQDLKTTIKALKADPSRAKEAKWPKFSANFTKTSRSLKKALGTGYRLVFRVGEQSPVLIYKDGFIVKNSFE